MPRVLIMGGGLAGLAAGWTIRTGSKGAIDVEILERGHVLGGKASSMRHRDADGAYDVDHGLHVFFDYPNFRRLLGEIDPAALDRLKPSPNGSSVYEEKSPLLPLKPVNLPSPLHLLGGNEVAKRAFRGSPGDMLALGRVFLAAMMLRPEELSPRERRRLDETSFAQFATALGVSPVTIGTQLFRAGERATFNYPFEPSALSMLLTVRMTQQNAKAQDVRHVDGPCGDVLIDPVRKAFLSAGGTITTHSPIARVTCDAERVTGVQLEGRPAFPHAAEKKAAHLSYYNTEVPRHDPLPDARTADCYVSALPPKALLAVLDGPGREHPYFARIARLRVRRTIAYQIYYDRVITPADAQGLVIGLPGPFSTLLDRARIWSAPDGRAPGGDASVIELVGEDDAGGPLAAGSEKAVERAMKDAEELVAEIFPEATRDRIVRRWFHKSGHDEYFVTDRGSDADRPGTASPLPNLFLAGDYTANGFGVVGMEGAVVSGIEAANHVLRGAGFAPREVLAMSEPGGLVPAIRRALKVTGLFRALLGYDEHV